MASPAQQILPQSGGGSMLISTPDANSATAYATLGRDIAQGQLYIVVRGTQQFVGGVTSRSVRETNGARFLQMAGNDWNEPMFGGRFWTGQVARWVIRGQDLKQMLQYLFNVTGGFDVDFRRLPIQYHYVYNQLSATNSAIDTESWDYMTCYVDNYTLSEPDSTGKQLESWDWIGKGESRTGYHGGSIGNSGALWYSQTNAPATQSASTAQGNATSTTGGITQQTPGTGGFNI